MKQIISMLPGIGGQIRDEDIDENALTRIESIIFSMTKKERRKPDILNASRKKRIAAGSGTSVEDINKLLRQYEQMRKMYKQMNTKGSKTSKAMKRMMGGMGGFGGGMPPGFPM